MESIDLFQRWRNANQAAVVAAKAVLVKSILALDGQGEPPAPPELEEARTLRCVADDLFELTVARSGEAAQARQQQAPEHAVAECHETSFADTWAIPMLP